MSIRMKRAVVSAIVCCAAMSCSKRGQVPAPAPQPTAPTAAAQPERHPASEPQPDTRETPVVPREKITLKMGESVQLTEFEDAFELRGFVVEHIEPDPEDPEDTGGAGIQMTIEVGSDIVMPYVDAAPGASYPVVWTDALRLEVVGYDHGGPAVEVLVDRISDEYDGDAVKLSLQKGDSGDIGGTTVRFESHSHKRTSRGQRSPLITKLTYDPEGEQITTYVSLYPPDDATWQWRNYEFHLVDWDYGDRIDLEVKRRKLLPVTASP